MQRNEVYKLCFSLCAAIYLLSSPIPPVAEEAKRGLASCAQVEDPTAIAEYSNPIQGGNDILQMMNDYTQRFQSADFQTNLSQIHSNNLYWQAVIEAQYKQQYLGFSQNYSAMSTPPDFRSFQPAGSLVAYTNVWSNLGVSFNSVATNMSPSTKVLANSQSPGTKTVVNSVIGNVGFSIPVN